MKRKSIIIVGIETLALFTLLALPVWAEDAVTDPAAESPRAVQLTVPAEATATEPSKWRFGGWASAGPVLMDDAAEAFSHSMLVFEAAADTPALFGIFQPYAVETFTLLLDERGFNDTDTHAMLTTGTEFDASNWTVFLRTSENTNERTAGGVGYFVDLPADLNASLMLKGMLMESGSLGVGVNGWYEFTPGYMVVGNGTWEPEGFDEARGSLSVRHYASPDVREFFEGGAFNAADRGGWGFFVGYGSNS